MESDHRKSRSKEQSKRSQSGRYKPPGDPLFGELIEKGDGDSRIKNILGNYSNFPSNWKDCLGVTDSTPKTPITTSHSNPFGSLASTATSRNSSNSGSGAHSSRHPIAASSTGLASSNHPGLLASSGASSKHSSLLSSTSSTRHQVAEPPKKERTHKETVATQPTNILRITKTEPSIKKHSRKLKTHPPQLETGSISEPTKKKKKKKRHVVVEGTQDEPTSLKVQLPKQTRPNDLVLTEDVSMDNVSSMVRELMNPLPPSLVTPIQTPIQATPFTFPNKIAISQNEEPTLREQDLVNSSSSDESSSDELDSEHIHIQDLSLITPLKGTPPHRLIDQIISPLAPDETANLSPAKRSGSSIGFSLDYNSDSSDSEPKAPHNSEDPLSFDNSGGMEDFFSSLKSQQSQPFVPETTQPFPVITHTQASKSPAYVSTEPARSSEGRGSGKRKRADQTTARKAPKLNVKDTVSLQRSISITSSECHSEEGEVSSDNEEVTQQSTVQSHMATLNPPRSFVVKFPLTDIQRVPDQHKPKATVEPYNIRQTSDSRPRSREDRHDDRSSRERGAYSSRHREDYRPYHRPNERSRSRRGEGRGEGGRWDYSSSRTWDYRNDEYSWTDESNNYRRCHFNNKAYPERYLNDARRKKHDADKIQPAGVEKARAYMDSVVLFMLYGDSTEQQSEDSGSRKTSAFRTYSETINIIKYCQNMVSDSKPLVVLCMKCHSILLWRMYIIKQSSATVIQKELQEYFVPTKSTQGKSPYHHGSSPLPSPASVGSTNSTGSWSGDPSPAATVTIPKHIMSKAAEHLTISGYASSSVELWKASETLQQQCQDFFSAHPRPRLSHCSPVSQVAIWTEKILRNFRTY